MNHTRDELTGNFASSTTPSGGWLWIYAAGFLLICALAVNNQSFWIDEGFAGVKAQQSTLSGWWQAMMLYKGSDLQMPLYMIWIWACGNVLGAGEVVLRAVNVFWLLPGLLALLRVFAGRPRMQIAIFLTTACSPFVWYYLNEARPYAMQLGASLFLAAALCHWMRDDPADGGDPGWVWGFVAAVVTMAGASLLGMIWATMPIIAAIVWLPKNRLRQLGSRHFVAWMTVLFSLGALGLYYLWTLKAGGRAAMGPDTNWKNLLYALYELFGFSGLGPGRLELRDSSAIGLFLPYLPQLLLYAAAGFVLLMFAARRLLAVESRGMVFGWLLLAAVPAGFISACGVFLHFRVLGRHFAPLFPFVVLPLALGITSAWPRGWAGKTTVALFLALSLVSGLSLRFSARHAKDDYRSAAAVANAALARGEKVWWNASDGAAAYYHVPLAPDLHNGHCAYFIRNPAPDSIPDINQADVIICSRPDIFDSGKTLRLLMAQNHFQAAQSFPSFVIWEKGASRP